MSSGQSELHHIPTLTFVVRLMFFCSTAQGSADIPVYGGPRLGSWDFRCAYRADLPGEDDRGDGHGPTADHPDAPTDTMVFTVPRATAPAARLRIVAPGGHETVCEFDGTSLTIGRAADNDLVLADSRVSRHHARLSGRRGTLVYSDLASTNGSRVNGVAVSELVLGAGDRIEVGDTVLVVETAGDVS